jgi:hypothetical protein
MSLFAPRTKSEEKFQYCNYGYDSSKFKSFDDCIANYDKYYKSNLPDSLPILQLPNEPIKKSTPKVTMKLTCNDGTISLGDFSNIIPCEKNGGVKSMTKLNTEQKSFFEEHKNHLLLVAGLVVGYLLYKKFKK